ncbi:MAG TPA: energy-coupling factor transporter transmembrane component T [Roseiflexaceae bacterium]|jgi:energy-coupling factor transport system permease protein|nr:energy-coupling factor transporter transmembrane component T [Roseiflexaceae bacterium]
MLATWNYKERDTIVQRLDPRARLIFVFCATIATVLLWDFRLVLIPAALALAQLLLARLTWRELRRFVIFVGIFSVLLTLLTLLTGRGGAGVYTTEHMIWQGRVLGLAVTLSAERLAFAATQLLRLFTMAALAVVLPFTIHPAWYGVTFRRLGLPDNLAFALELAVRFVPSLSRDFVTTLDAQRARGYELERAGGILKAIRNIAPLIVPVTIGSILKGEDVIDAMNLHAFGTGPRTWSQELRYRPADWALIVLGVGLLAGVIVLRFQGYGGLWVPEWLLAMSG